MKTRLACPALIAALLLAGCATDPYGRMGAGLPYETRADGTVLIDPATGEAVHVDAPVGGYGVPNGGIGFGVYSGSGYSPYGYSPYGGYGEPYGYGAYGGYGGTVIIGGGTQRVYRERPRYPGRVERPWHGERPAGERPGRVDRPSRGEGPRIERPSDTDRPRIERSPRLDRPRLDRPRLDRPSRSGNPRPFQEPFSNP